MQILAFGGLSAPTAVDYLVVAEGVEMQEQLEYLKKYRCDKMQGYIFSRPLPGSAAGPPDLACTHARSCIEPTVLANNVQPKCFEVGLFLFPDPFHFCPLASPLKISLTESNSVPYAALIFSI